MGTHPAAAKATAIPTSRSRSEEHTSELQSQSNLVCRLLLEKKKKTQSNASNLLVTVSTSPMGVLNRRSMTKVVLGRRARRGLCIQSAEFICCEQCLCTPTLK